MTRLQAAPQDDAVARSLDSLRLKIQPEHEVEMEQPGATTEWPALWADGYARDGAKYQWGPGRPETRVSRSLCGRASPRETFVGWLRTGSGDPRWLLAAEGVSFFDPVAMCHFLLPLGAEAVREFGYAFFSTLAGGCWSIDAPIHRVGTTIAMSGSRPGFALLTVADAIREAIARPIARHAPPQVRTSIAALRAAYDGIFAAAWLRIQDPSGLRRCVDRHQAGDSVHLISGWQAHAVHVVISGEYMALCNRGQQAEADGRPGITFYRNPRLLEIEFAHDFCDSLSYSGRMKTSASAAELTELALNARGFDRIHQIELSPLLGDSCAFAAAKAGLRADLILRACEGEPSKESLIAAETACRPVYKWVSTIMRVRSFAAADAFAQTELDGVPLFHPTQTTHLRRQIHGAYRRHALAGGACSHHQVLRKVCNDILAPLPVENGCFVAEPGEAFRLLPGEFAAVRHSDGASWTVVYQAVGPNAAAQTLVLPSKTIAELVISTRDHFGMGATPAILTESPDRQSTARARRSALVLRASP